MFDMFYNNIYKKINLDDIARKMGFDKSYLIKIFKQKYQITPIKYLLKLKIDAAAYMLENSNLSIKEIAYRLKFYDEYYFSRKFKELKKLSPKEYRINCKNNYAASQQQNCFMLNA
jgi:AraC-like DNA-binding protein